MSGPIAWYHQHYIHHRRVRVLAECFAELIAQHADVLDVGCGDGQLSAMIGERRPDISIRGMDVLVRQSAAIPVQSFDGETIPLNSDSVDTAIMVDVLHHTRDPERSLREAARVARKQVIVKDHYLQGFAAWRTLALMDHVGNARHGVEIPCNYLTPKRWDELYESTGLRCLQCREHLGLYPPPLNWLFERSLHFIALLEPSH